MSFILDALKKSENERQRTIGPSLIDAPVRRQQGELPWWAFAVAALLIVNLGVLLIVLMRNDDPAQAAPAAAPPAAIQSPATTAPVAAAPARNARVAGAPNTSPAVRSLAEEAGAYPEGYPEDSGETFDAHGSPQLAAAASVPPGPSIVRPIDAPDVAPLPARPTFEARAAAGTDTSDELLPTASALIAGGTSVPDLHLDIHVYSKNPAERFIFVNMRKYQEGQALAEGPSIERITPDGAVLNQQGLRYLLPRQ